MACNVNCKICPRIVISTAVTVITVDGVDTLVIDLPASSTFLNGYRYCIVVAQTIPTAATINMPVAFSIGGDTTTVYPFLNCNCAQVTACGVHSRTKYPVRISTSTTGGTFRSMRRLECYAVDTPVSIPVAVATTTLVEPAAFTPVVSSTATRKATTTTKEAAKNE